MGCEAGNLKAHARALPSPTGTPALNSEGPRGRSHDESMIHGIEFLYQLVYAGQRSCPSGWT